jgi:hypothetical protein
MASSDIELIITDLAQHGLSGGNVDESKSNGRRDAAGLTYCADNLLRLSTPNSRAGTAASGARSTPCSTYTLAVTLLLGCRV